MSLALERPTNVTDDSFNLMIWKQILQDEAVTRLPFKIESNEFGQVVMMPPPGRFHANYQIEVGIHLARLLPDGKCLGEFALSTTKGVKGPDVGWSSIERWDAQADSDIFLTAPEICVEILSPSNTDAEMAEKRALYFEKGAEEVWEVSGEGELVFYLSQIPEKATDHSELCPDFPKRL